MVVKGSEFGGVPGMIQPPPHPLTAAEEARLMRKMDADFFPGEAPQIASVEDARIQEAVSEGRGGITNPDGFGDG